jgi:hypothetical protein
MTSTIIRKSQVFTFVIALIIALFQPVFAVSHLAHLPESTSIQLQDHHNDGSAEDHFHQHTQTNHIDLSLTLIEVYLLVSKTSITKDNTEYLAVSKHQSTVPDIPPP